MTAIAIRDLKAHLSSVLAQVRQGHSVTVTVHRKPVATLEPLGQPDARGLPAIAGVVWRGAGHGLGRSRTAQLSARGETVSELLLRQRGE